MDTVEQAAALTPDQAHARLGNKVISRASFYAAINRGEVPHIRLGKRILIPRHAFEAWLERAGPTATAQHANGSSAKSGFGER
jgi:excisionase family DNA binding protein